MVTFGFPKDFLFVVGYLPSNDAIYVQSSLLGAKPIATDFKKRRARYCQRNFTIDYPVNNQFSVFR